MYTREKVKRTWPDWDNPYTKGGDEGMGAERQGLIAHMVEQDQVAGT